jgi:nucleoid-associated protein YgaU
MARNLFAFIMLALWLCGCASPPWKELRNAQQAVAQASAAGAARFAPQKYQAANLALSNGKELIRRGDYDKARELLPKAELFARHSILEVQKEQARIESEKRREEKARNIPLESPEPKEKPEPSPPPQLKPKPVAAPLPSPPPSSYAVGKGETLWTIAAQKEIYLDPLLWPLLYKANRDQIKDPRHIYPGQVLNIPREFTESEKEEAREKARNSDIFPFELLIKKHSPEIQ